MRDSSFNRTTHTPGHVLPQDNSSPVELKIVRNHLTILKMCLGYFKVFRQKMTTA